MRRVLDYPASTWSMALLSCLCLFTPLRAAAQTNQITTAIDPTRTVVLGGNVHAAARPANDIGLTDPARTLNHISINFKPSPARQSELDKLLADQQSPASPNFHVWLTPEQFGERFGLSPDDLARVTAWLRDAGFQVTGSAGARNWIAFDGTVDTVRRAFHTEIHNYRVNGEIHFANSTEPSVPTAIAALVSAITGLNDFRPTPMTRRIHVAPRASPDYTNGTLHILLPDDYATIYDIRPLYNSSTPYDGSGQKLVIVGASDITLSDIATFRSITALPAIQLQQVLVPGTTDPGHVSDAETEADLDIEWSGAVARNATIVYIYAPNALSAAQYALSPPSGTPIPGPVVSMSFGSCEPDFGVYSQTIEGFVQQGNAEGITSIAASGDSGAAGCDLQDSYPVAMGGLAVSIPAAIPEVTAVGGTEFSEGSGTYWSSTNSPTGASALSYIPEIAWNESSSAGLSASGGGVSIYYPMPAWQIGYPGVPAGAFRAVPDVALTAAHHDGYLWVSSAEPSSSVCASAEIVCSISGTSAAAPSFAGMIAILNQYAAARGATTSVGQGNINPTLYKLFSSAPAAFHDIVTGNNIVPCHQPSPDCLTGSYGYPAGVGYDPVTGLGSVDANNLITQWTSKSSLTPTTLTVTATPSALALNSSTVLTAKVSAIGGTPTGSVSFGISGAILGTATLSSGTASMTVSGSLFTAGSNTIVAVYGGDSNFNGSSSTAIVTVSLPTNASAVVAKISPNPVPEQAPNANGYTWFYTATLTETAGTATTLTGFSIGGVDYSAQIVNGFGTASIAANGSLVTDVSSKGYTPPATVPFVFSGMDASGLKWTQSTSVTLIGPQAAAAISLTSAPGIVYQNPAASSSCQWHENLDVQEVNGIGVTLNRFLANGLNQTPEITLAFGSTQLNPLGSLRANVCWAGISPPTTVSYELDGIDVNGNTVTGTASVMFEGALTTVSAMSLSQSTETFQIASTSQSTSATIAVNVPAGIAWSISTLPANQTTSWLTVVPAAGIGPGSVTVTAKGAGLSNSVFTATLTFQSPQAVPSYINVPVTLAIGSNPVVINAGGVVPVDSGATAIQPGSWGSIYGSNLASSTALWNGNFPTSLGNVTVTVDGKPAYLWFVSPGQINFQAPADAAVGPVNVVVTNSTGTARSAVTLSPQGPAFLLLADGTHATGLIIDPNGGGSQGGGTYDLLGPTSTDAGFRPVKPGEPLVLYGIGFGPTNPAVPPGQAYTCPATGCAQLVTNPQITVGGVLVQLTFAGIVEAGLYQFSFNLPPNVASGDQPLQAIVGGVQTPTNVFVSVQ